MKILKSLICLLLLPMLIGCQPTETDNKKLTIIATIFPQYDFAREIVGDKADVIMLLPFGVESHSFDPTPADMVNINKSDLFIYTGKYMESWATRLIDGMTNTKTTVLDVSTGINLDKSEDEHEHEHNYDPHIWTSPVITKQMVDNILNSLCELDKDNAEYYKTNAEAYKKELDLLDEEFRSIVANKNRDELIFGGRFSFHYLFKEYGLNYKSPYDSCSTETEPSAKTVATIIDEIKSKNIPTIYYEAMVDPKVAKSISNETGAKMLLFHSCHNISKQEFDKGENYITLMKQNALNLKEGLQ